MEVEGIGPVDMKKLFGDLDDEAMARVSKLANASMLRGGIEHVTHCANHLNTIGEELYKNPPEDTEEKELSAVLDALAGIIKVMDEYVESCVEQYNKIAIGVMYGADGEN